jgi:xanthine dehydrogenase accessory factor
MTLPINSSEKASNLLGVASKWSKAGPVALATLVYIDGNAQYPIGALMLVAPDGRFEGQITGGCAERAIADHAIEAISSGQNVIHRYGLDSPFFDIQLPCGSGIDVYFDVCISQQDFAMMEHQINERKTLSYSVLTKIGEFTKTFTPQPLLVIAGQGPIVIELARCSQLIGFDTLILAQNEATQVLCNQHSLESTLMSGDEFLQLPQDEFIGIVSLFHEHDFEVPLFRHTLSGNYFYFGALGSRRTHAARLACLLEAGVAPERLNCIHGPVGVDIVASTPSQIAIAIVAQATDELNKMLNEQHACRLTANSDTADLDSGVAKYRSAS